MNKFKDFVKKNIDKRSKCNIFFKVNIFHKSFEGREK